MFNLSIMLDLDLTNETIQTLLANAQDLTMNEEGPFTCIWIYSLNVKIEIQDNQVQYLYSLRSNQTTLVWSKTTQSNLVASINEIEIAKKGQCLLVVAAHNKRIALANQKLQEMGELLERVCTGGLK